jgi:hypothetical protein
MGFAQDRYRNICFTLNNYSEVEYNQILNIDCFKYVIIGKEVSKTGTKHLQGCGELKSQMRLNKIKKEINDRMHFERRYGNQK